MTRSLETSKADYGLDAPKVVRNLFVVSALGWSLWLSAKIGLWSGVLRIPAGGDNHIGLSLAPFGLVTAIACAFMGCWMVWDSKIGKVAGREKLLDHLTWRGDEQVLDIGCGRGLMLIGAAKRLTLGGAGKASGIDIWQAEDLSGNKPEATLENARREGVQDRVEVKSADMRELPFSDRTIDVVVSRAAIHNLYSRDDRVKAIREIARVLVPGGRTLIDDIRHGTEYAATFAANGCTDIRRLDSRLVGAMLMIFTVGSLRPATLLVTKAG